MRRRITEQEYIQDRIAIVESGCWEWTQHCNADGYGVSWYRGKWKRSHRFSYETFVGPIPAGLELDHLCRNRRCVNPTHLEAVTHKENILRGDGWGGKHSRVTHCPKGHPLDEENTYYVTTHYRGSPARECLICRRERNRTTKAEKLGSVPREIYLEKMRSQSHCKHGHEFTDENTYVNPRGHRVCRTCKLENQRAAERARGVVPWDEKERAEHCVNGHAYTPENTYEYERNGRTYRHCRACNRESVKRAKAKRV